ncbi:unnamed protein product [Trifolium pratense]|uniref:Uncharacterized protein n=2 Tax=Trifolium pratense TaxID=57577 RepID=A0ACB0LC49_TRIPR|nr:unnamed protein product [Trifolium pratense]CAJ2667744.1 unnamed protein product [Trifolium pratense]
MSSKSSNNTVLLRFFIIKSSKPTAPRFKSVPTKLLFFKEREVRLEPQIIHRAILVMMTELNGTPPAPSDLFVHTHQHRKNKLECGR